MTLSRRSDGSRSTFLASSSKWVSPADGFTWSGTERITRIAAWPSWTPPPEMHRRGGLRNPQGARALYLGNTVYRIHGTNNDRTVGRANSSGCFRLSNEHVVHLASIAKAGRR